MRKECVDCKNREVDENKEPKVGCLAYILLLGFIALLIFGL